MKPHVVFLCTGNICRSPLAEVLAQEMFKDIATGFSSAGLDAVEGLPASRESARFAAGRGLSLARHASRPLSAEIVDGADWLIGMTRSHAVLARRMIGARGSARVGLLGAPGLDLRAGGATPDVAEVADPYGGPREAYEAMGRQVELLLQEWAGVFRDLAAGKDDRA